MNLKKELLNEIKSEVRSSQNPEVEALSLFANASEVQSKFERALKKPISGNRSISSKRVQFVEEKSNPTESMLSPSNGTELQKTQPKKAPGKENSKQSASVSKPTQQQKPVSQTPSERTLNLNPPQQSQRSKAEPPRTEASARPESSIQKQPQPILVIKPAPKAEESPQKERQEEEPAPHRHHRHHHHHQHHHHRNQQAVRSEERQLHSETILFNQIQEHLVTIRKLDMNQQILKQALKQQEEENHRLKLDVEQLTKQLSSDDQQRSTQLIAMRNEVYSLKESNQNQNLKIIELTHTQTFLERQISTLQTQLEHYQTKEVEQEEMYSKLKSSADQYKLKLLDSEGHCARVDQQLQHLIQNVSLYTNQAKEANTENRQLIQQVTQLESEKTRLSSELQLLRLERNENQQSLHDRINHLKQENESLKQQHQREFTSLDSLKQERDHWKHECDVLKVNVMEVEELRKRLHLKEAEIELLQTDNDKLKWKVRKDPNGILSDLKTMPITVYEQKVNLPQSTHENELQNEIDKLKQTKMHLSEENDRFIVSSFCRLKSENRRLIMQLEQSDITMGELRSMFARERHNLEEQLYAKNKQTQVLGQIHQAFKQPPNTNTNQAQLPTQPEAQIQPQTNQPPNTHSHYQHPTYPEAPPPSNVYYPQQYPHQSYPVKNQGHAKRGDSDLHQGKRVQFSEPAQDPYRSPYDMPPLTYPVSQYHQYH